MELSYTEDEVCRNFPEVLEQVRAGNTVVVTRAGETVAEISFPRGKMAPGETRMEYLERTGQLSKTDGKWSGPKNRVRIEGALERFLKERG